MASEEEINHESLFEDPLPSEGKSTTIRRVLSLIIPFFGLITELIISQVGSEIKSVNRIVPDIKLASGVRISPLNFVLPRV